MSLRKRPKLLILAVLNELYQCINESICQYTGLRRNTDDDSTGVRNLKLVMEKSQQILSIVFDSGVFDCVFWALLTGALLSGNLKQMVNDEC